jgi:hypothetical protein
VDRASQATLDAAMYGADPVFPSVVRVEADELLKRHPGLRKDAKSARVMRSVLMKPEHEAYVGTLHKLLEEAAAQNVRPRARQQPTALPVATAT